MNTPHIFGRSVGTTVPDAAPCDTTGKYSSCNPAYQYGDAGWTAGAQVGGNAFGQCGHATAQFGACVAPAYANPAYPMQRPNIQFQPHPQYPWPNIQMQQPRPEYPPVYPSPAYIRPPPRKPNGPGELRPRGTRAESAPPTPPYAFPMPTYAPQSRISGASTQAFTDRKQELYKEVMKKMNANGFHARHETGRKLPESEEAYPKRVTRTGPYASGVGTQYDRKQRGVEMLKKWQREKYERKRVTGSGPRVSLDGKQQLYNSINQQMNAMDLRTPDDVLVGIFKDAARVQGSGPKAVRSRLTQQTSSEDENGDKAREEWERALKQRKEGPDDVVPETKGLDDVVQRLRGRSEREDGERWGRRYRQHAGEVAKMQERAAGKTRAEAREIKEEAMLRLDKLDVNYFMEQLEALHQGPAGQGAAAGQQPQPAVALPALIKTNGQYNAQTSLLQAQIPVYNNLMRILGRVNWMDPQDEMRSKMSNFLILAIRNCHSSRGWRDKMLPFLNAIMRLAHAHEKGTLEERNECDAIMFKLITTDEDELIKFLQPGFPKLTWVEMMAPTNKKEDRKAAVKSALENSRPGWDAEVHEGMRVADKLKRQNAEGGLWFRSFSPGP